MLQHSPKRGAYLWFLREYFRNVSQTLFLHRQKERGSPLEVYRGDVEDDSFEPQDHEEPLGERAVPDALAITPRLK